MRHILLLLVGITLLLSADISILSKTKTDSKWEIHYATKPNQVIAKTLLASENREINSTNITFPHAKLVSSVLFLIDTSSPMKQEFHNGVKPAITEIFSLKQPWDKWAIAGFAEEMKVFGDYNQTNSEDALKSMSVGGQRTELFRASLKAIDSLNAQNTKRKFLFIFSDGEAEDNAYTNQEVIKKANESHVSIISFGYKDSIYLQSLRRLSEETGGRLFIANKTTYQLSQKYIQDLNDTLHNDALIDFKISELKPNTKGVTTLELKVYFEDNSSVSKTFTLEVEKIIKKEESFLLYYIAGASTIVLIILFIFFKPKKIMEEAKSEDLLNSSEPIAYFKSASGSKEYIYKRHNSIGALADNDIVIEDEYISRHHAVLDYKDGEFFIIDNNSANGLYVNYKKIYTQNIHDTDVISFGPYEVIFKIVNKGNDGK